jgi:hypothetical protein
MTAADNGLYLFFPERQTTLKCQRQEHTGAQKQAKKIKCEKYVRNERNNDQGFHDRQRILARLGSLLDRSIASQKKHEDRR